MCLAGNFPGNRRKAADIRPLLEYNRGIRFSAVRTSVLFFQEVATMKKILYPLLALALGAAGYLLRTRQLAEAIHPDTGLLILAHPATYALIGLTAGAALVLLILSLTVASEAQNWYAAFHADSPLPRLLSYIGALGFGATTLLVLYLLTLSGLPYSLLELPFQSFFGLLMIFACAAAFFLTGRNGDSGSTSLAPVIPGFTCCVWLVLTYHSNASNPSVMAFLWQLLAVIAACMSWYYTAGFAFQHPHPRRTVFFYLMTITLCITALADRTELYQQVLLASTALWFLGRSILLVDNTQYSGKRAS